MARYDKLTWAISDPGTGTIAEDAAAEWPGGKAYIHMDLTAAASSTVIDVQMRVGGLTYTDLNDRNGTQVTLSANGAAGAALFDLGDLPACDIQMNVTGGGGATTTGNIVIVSGKHKSDG